MAKNWFNALNNKDQAKFIRENMIKMPFHDFMIKYNKLTAPQKAKVRKLLAGTDRVSEIYSYQKVNTPVVKNTPKKQSALSSVGYAILFAALVIGSVHLFNGRETCSDKIKIGETTTVEDATYYIGYDVTTPGHIGTQRVCTKNGKETSRVVTIQPVNSIRTIGTKPVITNTSTPTPTYTAPVVQQNTTSGSLCNDGTYSSSTGRGTCSWHGGVAN